MVVENMGSFMGLPMIIYITIIESKTVEMRRKVMEKEIMTSTEVVHKQPLLLPLVLFC